MNKTQNINNMNLIRNKEDKLNNNSIRALSFNFRYNKTNDNFCKTEGNIINTKGQFRYKKKFNLTLSKPKYRLCDPYFINICKKAIIEIKNEVPNYKDIIYRISNEYGVYDSKPRIKLKTSSNFSKKKLTFERTQNTFPTLNQNKIKSLKK